ncbi:MAG: DUF1302 domain-containing protein, partial [Deltaproteobacteria bacterium]|nr:DUF1302 domain-containing protein [Deltaproteobacteria bacterium]
RDGFPRLRYLENRKLYGVSANFPVGDLAVGWELSYRPKDAIALSPCFNPGGKFDANFNNATYNQSPTGACEQWMDAEKYQTALTGILSLTPGDYGWALNLLGADTATMMAEAVVIRYVGVSPSTKYTRTTKDGYTVVQGPSANLNFWQNNDPEAGGPITGTEGTEYSGGYTVDFNWVYDGKLIPGWQVIPGFTFTHAVFGDTPTAGPTYLHGNKALNLYVLFNQNPATWQAGLNYAMFFGDDMRQPYRDRNFLGGFVSYNF